MKARDRLAAALSQRVIEHAFGDRAVDTHGATIDIDGDQVRDCLVAGMLAEDPTLGRPMPNADELAVAYHLAACPGRWVAFHSCRYREPHLRTARAMLAALEATEGRQGAHQVLIREQVAPVRGDDGGDP